MATVRLKCAGARVLFYEPDGLLLSSSLTPVDEQHSGHLLTFQLSYLGLGDIAVDVAVQDGSDAGRSVAGHADFVDVALKGMTAGALPGVWLTSVAVPDGDVHYRLIVWGQPGGGDSLRGELKTEVYGRVPLLTATTRASVTRAELATRGAELTDCVVLNGPWVARRA